jgi:hypothetical protein
MMGLVLGACGPGNDSLSRASRRAVLDNTRLALGPTPVGMPVEGHVRMTNVGEGRVTAQLTLSPSDTPFIILNRSINADSSGTDIPVRLLALEPGTFDATLTFTTNGEEPSVLTVELHAEVEGLPNCDDHNPCTLDLLQGTSCTHVAVGGACDDGQACTVADHCSEGACVGQPITCDDGVDCTVDSCDAVLGCVFLPRQEACEDGNPCTANTCAPGVGCTTATAPNGTLCGVPACDAMPLCVAGSCVTTRAPDGFPCEDGDPCSVGDHCVQGTCERGLGEPMGVGDPIVVAASSPRTLGHLDPAAVLGLQPLPNGRLRVAWRAVPDCGAGPCPLDECTGGEIPVLPSEYTLRLSVVDVAGNHLEDLTLDPPQPLAAAVNAAATLTDAGLFILANFQTVPSCGDASSRVSGPQVLTVAYRVDTDGTLHGPEQLAQAPLDTSLGTSAQLPLAVGAVHNTVALVHGSTLHQQCLGACPDSVTLSLQRFDAATWPPQLLEEASHALPLTGPSLMLDAVENVGVTLTADQVVMAWRQQWSLGGLVCGPVDEVLWRASSFRAQVGHLGEGQVQVEGDNVRATGVSVTSGSLGPALFVSSLQVAGPSDCAPDAPDCSPTECSVSETVTLTQGGETTAVFTQDGTPLLASLSSGTAFGRAVAVMMDQDGKVSLASPALGPLPAVSAEYSPDPSLPVRLMPGSAPLLVPSGRDAWLGALLGAPQLDPSLRGIAVIQAGCGKSGTGTILGWPPPTPDAGIPTVDAGGMVLSTSAEDGGIPDGG